MDIQVEKYKIIEWLMKLDDETIITEIKKIKLSRQSEWEGGISDTEKLLVQAGLKDVEEGNTFTHEEIMEEIQKIYGI